MATFANCTSAATGCPAMSTIPVGSVFANPLPDSYLICPGGHECKTVGAARICITCESCERYHSLWDNGARWIRDSSGNDAGGVGLRALVGTHENTKKDNSHQLLQHSLLLESSTSGIKQLRIKQLSHLIFSCWSGSCFVDTFCKKCFEGFMGVIFTALNAGSIYCGSALDYRGPAIVTSPQPARRRTAPVSDAVWAP